MESVIKFLLSSILFLTVVQAQVPILGPCPPHTPMVNFKMDKFLGKWYELKRYFTITELASKCIAATYERRADGNIYVNNEVTNRLSGFQRIISGVMSSPVAKSTEGKFNVKYTGFPGGFETTLNVLETDYKSYAVIWSCSGFGPFGHSESVWVMGRSRVPNGATMQRIYGVLDKFKISRFYFLETDQNNCETVAPAQETIETVTNAPVNDDADGDVEVVPVKVGTSAESVDVIDEQILDSDEE